MLGFATHGRGQEAMGFMDGYSGSRRLVDYLSEGGRGEGHPYRGSVGERSKTRISMSIL